MNTTTPQTHRTRSVSLSQRLIAASCSLSILSLSLATAFPARLAHADPVARFDADTLERSMLDFYCYFPDQDLKDCPEATFGKPRKSGAGPLTGTPSGAADDPSGLMIDPSTPGAEQTSNATPARPSLNAADLRAYALEIFDHIALLDTSGFNDVMVHLSSDYRNHPEHRAAIEMLLEASSVQHSSDVGADAIREKLRSELKGDRERNDVVTVVDGIIVVFSIAYAFQFGKGAIRGGKSLWMSRGKGLGASKRFRDSIQIYLDTMKETKILQTVEGRRAINYKNLRNFGLKLGGGTAVGLGKVLYDSLQTYKIDPRHTLDPIRKDIVLDLGTVAAEARDDLRLKLKESPAQLFSNLKPYREKITELDRKVTRIKDELEHLYNVAAELRPELRPIAEDLTEIRGNLAKLGGLLDQAELEADPDLAPAPSRPGSSPSPFLGATPSCQKMSAAIQAELLGAALLTDPALVAASGRNRAAIREIVSGIRKSDVTEFYTLRYSALHADRFEKLVSRVQPRQSKAPASPLRSIESDATQLPRQLVVTTHSVVQAPVTVSFRGKPVVISGLQLVSRQPLPGLSVADSLVLSCDYPSAYADRDPMGAAEATVDGLGCEAFTRQFLPASCGGLAQ